MGPGSRVDRRRRAGGCRPLTLLSADIQKGTVMMKRTLIITSGVVAAALGAAAWWRRHPRFGAGFVNRVVDPWLVRRGLVARSGGELGLLEHVGRRSGMVRVSPVHPVPIDGGFRIVVPLGQRSHWARNVLAAGRCRLQIGESVHELTAPELVSPRHADGVVPLAGRLEEWLGFRYLVLREAPQVAAEPDAPAPETVPEHIEADRREPEPVAVG